MPKHIFFPDIQPHQIPQLPIIDQIVSQVGTNIDFSKTVIVGAQHILETTATLFQALIKLGADPQKIYLSGKSYSTSPAVAKSFIDLGIQLTNDVIPAKPGEYQQACQAGIRKMWEQVQTDLKDKHNDVETILVIDDGFRCFEEMPSAIKSNYKVAGVEQTRGGLYSNIADELPFPLIEVATSVTKRQLESPLIATAVFKRIEKFLSTLNLQNGTTYGIIGYGSIGKAITNYLLKNGTNVSVFDESDDAFQNTSANSKLSITDNVEDLIRDSDYIFGCTGRDITENIDALKISTGKFKTFVSTTSEDREFLTLLKALANKASSETNPLEDISFFSDSGYKITVKNGGYPVNFDKQPWNVPAEDIELTQCLMLGSCIQAALAATNSVCDDKSANKTTRQMLDPYLQRYVVSLWKQREENKNRYSSDLLDSFDNHEWITNNSGGKFCDTQLMRNIFETVLAQSNFFGCDT